MWGEAYMEVELTEQEEDALDQLLAEEEEVEEEIKEEEIFEEGEESPSELEELFPDEKYTVYYQEV